MYKKHINMAFIQSKYISKYNKNNYKLYQFRVKKSDQKLISFLDNVENRNKLILSLLQEEAKKVILTIEQIKEKVAPICKEYGVKHVWLFGSYARGTATRESDVDLLIDGMTPNLPWGGAGIYPDMEEALGKSVDIVNKSSIQDKEFLKEIEKDLIQLF